MFVWYVTHLTNKCDIMQWNCRFQECAVSLRPKPKPKDLIPFKAGESGVKLNTGPRMFYNWAGSYLIFQHLVKRNRRTRVQKQSTHKWESYHCSTCTTTLAAGLMYVCVRVEAARTPEAVFSTGRWAMWMLFCSCFKRMYLWWSLRTLYLLACQMRVTVGNSHFCCVCVASFKR